MVDKLKLTEEIRLVIFAYICALLVDNIFFADIK